MGEIADMVLMGILCQECGVYIDDSVGGFPRSCEYCKESEEEEQWNF